MYLFIILKKIVFCPIGNSPSSSWNSNSKLMVSNKNCKPGHREHLITLRKGPNHYKEKCKCTFIRKHNIASDNQHLELSEYLKCVPIFLCSGRNILQLYSCITFKHIWMHSWLRQRESHHLYSVCIFCIFNFVQDIQVSTFYYECSHRNVPIHIEIPCINKCSLVCRQFWKNK